MAKTNLLGSKALEMVRTVQSGNFIIDAIPSISSTKTLRAMKRTILIILIWRFSVIAVNTSSMLVSHSKNMTDISSHSKRQKSSYWMEDYHFATSMQYQYIKKLSQKTTFPASESDNSQQRKKKGLVQKKISSSSKITTITSSSVKTCLQSAFHSEMRI